LSIKDFRSSPLPDRIVFALIEATQAYSIMDTLINEYSTITPVLHDMLLSLDIYYDLYNIQPDITDICIGLHIPTQENTASEYTSTILKCGEYAQSKAQITDVLTAGDILKIDRTIKSMDLKQLTADYDAYYVDAIWSILHDLYEPRRQYFIHLEAGYSVL